MRFIGGSPQPDVVYGQFWVKQEVQGDLKNVLSHFLESVSAILSD